MIINPIRKGTITQKYGDNPALYQKRFGIKFHNGVDIVSFHGDRIYSPEAGIAYKIYNLKNGSVSKGYGVCILGDSDENGVCNEWVMWHTMSDIQVKQGARVAQGEKVAFEGDSGAVYVGNVEVSDNLKGKRPYPGTHLHWGLRKVKKVLQPSLNTCLSDINGGQYKYIDGDSKTYFYEILNIDNGVMGFIDPLLEAVVSFDDFLALKAPKADNTPNSAISESVAPKIDEIALTESEKGNLTRQLTFVENIINIIRQFFGI